VKPTYLACAAILLLNGCANRGVPPEIAAKPMQYNQCMQDLSAKPEFDSIRAKMLFPVKDTPLEALDNKDKPTQQEKAAISAWNQSSDTCQHFQDDFVNFFAKHDPSFRVPFQTFRSKGQDNLLALYQGKITYGEALMERKKNSDELQRQIASISKSNRDKEQEVELRKQAIEATKPPPPIFIPPTLIAPAIPRPTTTNCNRIGNNVTCSTF
jgi:hypothetical protein